MADKRKADERVQETDRQFLESSNIKQMMKDLLGKMLANRPPEPLAFMASYFESLDDQTNLVLKAYQHITLTNHHRPAFQRNLKAAYNLLSQHKVKKDLRGVSGSVYADLLIMLTKDIPPAIVNKLMKKIECMEFEAVTYETFKSGVFTCCVLQDYVKLTKKLFGALDMQNSGKIDKSLSTVILDQLESALNQSNSSDTVSILQSGYSLSPEGLTEALEKAYKPSHKSTVTVTCEDFTSRACECFLVKVKTLR